MTWTAMGPHWFFGVCENKTGKIYFFHGKEPLPCPRRFAVYFAPYSLIQNDDKSAAKIVEGRVFHATATNLGTEITTLSSSYLIPLVAAQPLPDTAEGCLQLVLEAPRKITIGSLKSPSFQTERLKSVLDEHLEKDLKFAELAFKLRANPSTLSREFKLETGLTPNEYLELLRKTHQVFKTLPDGSLRTRFSDDF